MVYRAKHSIISANQRDMPSHGVTCWVRGDLQGQRAVTRGHEEWPPSSPDRCAVGAGFKSYVAAFLGVIFLDRKPLPGLFPNAVTTLCLRMAAWWSVISVEEKFNCTVLWQAAEEHWGSFSNGNIQTHSHYALSTQISSRLHSIISVFRNEP